MMIVGTKTNSSFTLQRELKKTKAITDIALLRTKKDKSYHSFCPFIVLFSEAKEKL